MDYIRFFSREKGFNAWSNVAPEMKHLLDCFDVKSNMEASVPVANSVFHAMNDVERLQNVASFFSTNPRKAEKQFGLRITTEDCEKAGIQIAQIRGETGVRFVDKRHADLLGTPTKFKSLATIIIARIWEGEQRLQAFPPHSILGEVAVISQFIGQVDDDASERCSRVLERNRSMIHSQGSEYVDLCGQLLDGEHNVDVIARRRLKFAR